MEVLILLGLFLIAVKAQQCYYPDGSSTTTDWTACNAAAPVSHCCNEHDLCLDNGYCFAQAGWVNTFYNRVYRGACADPTFDSSSCPQYCKDGKSARKRHDFMMAKR